MGRRLYVGNLNFNTSEDTLRDAFEAFGTVKYVKILTDRETGKSRGFGFVEFDQDAEAATAMHTMNGSEVDKRKLIVNEAHEKERR
jgi:RNA recognition motif-containing protein